VADVEPALASGDARAGGDFGAWGSKGYIGALRWTTVYRQQSSS